MSFDLPPEYVELQASVRKLAQEKVAPRAREIDSSWDEAHALAGLGRCALAAGHAAEANDRLRQALEIFERIGAAEADGLSAELDAMRASAHAGSDDFAG